MLQRIPEATLAFIGGSGTFSLNFPEDLNFSDVIVLQKNLVFDTPFGNSPPFKLFEIAGNKILTMKMHGRQRGVSWAKSSQQVFWVLKQAGVKQIISEGGVGSVNHLLDLRDIVIPTDYIDHSVRRNVHLTEDYLCIMRQPICPYLHRVLLEQAQANPLNRVFSRGTYVVTDGRHFESPAETNLYYQWGADIVGQSLAPEVYLAREIGACYASINLVVNYGEGIVKPWEHKELKEIFFNDALKFGQIILNALREVDLSRDCSCRELRKPTLLREENIGTARR
ncbi:MAG: hypothetical protein PWQ96_2153 [Clostridia bacterium]|jgi:5'-methylthioadenosine phosphorylase|nr:Pnp [Clostridiales bacterium]MDK2986509.1 hypothetical protein [Clostridia bacterium]